MTGKQNKKQKVKKVADDAFERNVVAEDKAEPICCDHASFHVLIEFSNLNKRINYERERSNTLWFYIDNLF